MEKYIAQAAAEWEANNPTEADRADWTDDEKRSWIAAEAKNISIAASNRQIQQAAKTKKTCDACGDCVPCKQTPRGWLCEDCRRDC